MANYGAKELRFHRFGGGLVLDLDSTEIRADQAADAQNVDLSEEVLRKRLGRAAYSASAPTASKVWGLGTYYPKSGSRKLLMQAGTSIYESDGAGGWTAAVTGLGGGAPMDFLQWRDLLLAGNGVDAVRKRTAAGVWSSSALLAAPGESALAAEVLQSQIEAFDDDSVYTLVGSNLTAGEVTDVSQDGTSIKITATGTGARGSHVHADWSAGDQDLSKMESVSLWFYCQATGPSFQVAVKDNAGNLSFAGWPIWTATQVKTWQQIRVPLSLIAPADRTASTGFGIRFVDDGDATFNVAIWFDDARPAGPFPPDTYHYYLTYASVDADGNLLAESNPYSDRDGRPVPADALISAITPAKGIGLTLTGSGSASVNRMRLWRRREAGEITRARLVATLADDATQLNGAIDASVQTVVLDTTAGLQVGAVLTVDTEELLVTEVESGVQVQAARGHNGTSPASHSDNAPVTVTGYLDTTTDDVLLIENREELQWGKMAPPLASTYAFVGDRLLAGDVTINSTRHPWGLYLSRLGFVEEFGSAQRTFDSGASDPNGAGWIFLPERDRIRRILDVDGMAVIFCDRSIWTLEGTGWDNFRLRKRASVGLDAREAVVQWERFVFFLATDGFRALSPNRSNDGLFETWLLSDPVGSRLRAIPPASRSLCACGVDERRRVHLSFVRAGETDPDAALVFDPSAPGALAPNLADPRIRSGWTYYTNWGFSCFASLKRGAGDAGQLLGGDPTTGKVHYLQRSSADAELVADDGAAIAWSWTSRAVDAGTGRLLTWVYVGSEHDVQVTQHLVASPIVNRALHGSNYPLSTNAATYEQRVAVGVRGRVNALKLSGSHSVAMGVHSAVIGYWER